MKKIINKQFKHIDLQQFNQKKKRPYNCYRYHANNFIIKSTALRNKKKPPEGGKIY